MAGMRLSLVLTAVGGSEHPILTVIIQFLSEDM